MFSLFYGVWNYVFGKTEFHVFILGVHKADKTVMFLKLIYIFSAFGRSTWLYTDIDFE
jgi:ADP-ribosylation factor related protein 1